MSERKVLNKYYPPDFDPSKIPRMKLAKNRQYTVRLMAPFNMRCKTCGEYIYKGKKFNARKEDVENQTYLGIRIYRFYIKCTRCLQEISFKTDPQNTDYEIEAGATRNFMALKLAEEQARREEEEAREEEANNPMKLLENRTKQSRNEIELLESLEELRELNQRQQVINYDGMLQQYNNVDIEQKRLKAEEEDEDYIKSVKFKNSVKVGKVIAEEIIEELSEVNETKLDNDKSVRKGMSSCSVSTGASQNLVNKAKSLKKRQLPLVVTTKQPAKKIAKTFSTVLNTTEKSQGNIAEKALTKNAESIGTGLQLLGTYSDSSSSES